MLYPLSTRALPLTSKSYGVRESKKIKQGAMGLNELTYITKKNIIKLTCRITKKVSCLVLVGLPVHAISLPEPAILWKEREALG
jgi:hypothetical protein